VLVWCCGFGGETRKRGWVGVDGWLGYGVKMMRLIDRKARMSTAPSCHICCGCRYTGYANYGRGRGDSEFGSGVVAVLKICKLLDLWELWCRLSNASCCFLAVAYLDPTWRDQKSPGLILKPTFDSHCIP